MVYVRSRIIQVRNSLGFGDTNRSRKNIARDGLQRKRICLIVDDAVSVDHRDEINENEGQILWPCQRIRTAMKLEGDGDEDYSVIDISQNTEKSPSDLRKLDVTQTPVKRSSAYAGVNNSQGITIMTISNMANDLERLKEGSKAEIHIDLPRMTQKN